MTASGKSFEQHSARWQREQLRNGVDPKRFNSWAKLSPSSKKTVDRTSYAQGGSAVRLKAEARRNNALKQLVQGLEHKTGRAIKGTRVIKNVRKMSRKQLKQLENLLSTEGGIDKIRQLASRRPPEGGTNVWWY